MSVPEARNFPPAEPPWLSPEVLEQLAALERGHRRAFGRPLLPEDPGRPARLRGQELFAAAEVVLAHDGAADPRLTYANRAALRLWRRRWTEMVGLPSRLTAEPAERRARAEALDQARLMGGIRSYAGIRIDSEGRRFRIEGARIWSPVDAEGRPCGQAAAFGDWWWLEPPGRWPTWPV